MPGDDLIVSVVMPYLNEAETLDRCVVAAREALETAGIPGEIIVADNDVFARSDALIPVTSFDGTHLPVPDGAAEAVLLVDVLHHAEDAVTLLRECARVAPVVVVKDHLADSKLDEQILRFMDWVGNVPHGVVLPYHYFSTASWAMALSAAGLRETDRGGVPGLYPFPFSLVFGGRLHFVGRLQPSR